MSRGRAKQVVTHRYGEKHNAVVYRLKKAPPKVGREMPMACVQVIPQGTVEKAELAEKIAKASLGLSPRTVEYVLDLMRDVLAEELKSGRQVALDDAFSFGVAMEGMLSPEQPLEAKHLALRPWVRFTPAFAKKLNTGAAIRYAEPLQPAEVSVKAVEAVGDNTFEASGKFHNIQSLTVEIVVGETLIPCSIHLATAPRSTRNIGKHLIIVAQQPPPAGELTFRFTWLDAIGEERTLLLPLTV